MIAAVVFVSLLAAADPVADPNTLGALARISAASMRGHVSFLASDLLEGRGTPSRGQDIAAEYIASQFRRAGLEPVAAADFFQQAKFVSVDSVKAGASFELAMGGKRLTLDFDKAAVQTASALTLSGVAVVKIAPDAAGAGALRGEDIRGRVVALYLTRVFGPDAESRYEFIKAVRELKPALLLLTGPGSPRQQHPRLLAEDDLPQQVPLIGVREGELADTVEHAAPGVLEGKADVTLPAPKLAPATLRNVVGVVRGSDPVLKDTYVMVTAHYDHVGMKPDGDGDRIFNGANDDASGTACLMDLAAALAAMNPRPRRSVLFVALFGEEAGLLGSEYYGRHPVVPLRQTIADINLEHMGRTDGDGGVKLASATFTGFEFSDVPALFKQAGEHTGITVYNDQKRGDAFFARSDNQALADVGIPAHTICVVYEFPDYHGVGDEWPKIDYENMAKVNRMVALGVINMANSETTPHWNPNQPKAKKYAEVWRALHADAAQ